ncbi:TetR/AcrR family transcriptional regulator [Collimonas sp.]|jgi:AcrR family transcriptional regulator|uniref:TetR/AcrR family transcriptional regulator n=1 Tax=Collimonas sp. TaxID=1963772 RepID=UPI002BBDA0F2|nr:TetR/AcrR family transcriptional regulator [Collimonas sp.]HWW05268.1 TetR/AcrR family transcriptional regulator [Collimonas sp.]
MEQKENKRARGRPRAYDPEQAFSSARDVFWRSGYAGSSLDDLSAATGMNRPSLYAAFGDKHALYLQTLDRYIEASRQKMDQVLAADLPLAQALQRIYDLALAMYLPSGDQARGCLLIGTAATPALADIEVRDRLGDGLRSFDQAFEIRLQRALEQGELAAGAEPALLAKLASAILHTLALRSRAGDTRASLEATAAAGVKLICGV